MFSQGLMADEHTPKKGWLLTLASDRRVFDFATEPMKTVTIPAGTHRFEVILDLQEYPGGVLVLEGTQIGATVWWWTSFCHTEGLLNVKIERDPEATDE